MCVCTRGRGSSQNKEEQIQRWAISETQHTGEAGEEQVADKTERKSKVKPGFAALLRSTMFILKGQEEPSKGLSRLLGTDVQLRSP